MSAAPLLKTSLMIEVLTGPHAGQKLSFDQNILRIGRDQDNDVALTDDPKVSRFHAEIRCREGQYELVNLSQKNFTLVRGQKIDNYSLHFGEKFYVGDSELLFTGPPPALVAVDSMADNMSDKTVVVAQKKTALSPLRPLPTPTPMTIPQNIPMPMGPPPPQGPPPSGNAGFRPPPAAAYRQPQSKGGRGRFYTIVAVVGVLVYFVFFSGKKKNIEEVRFDVSPTVERQLQQAEEVRKQLEEKKNKMGTLQAQRAQENFTKGFRDFRQGQYSRARESFQVVLTLEPTHEEARRYLILSKLKFDEQVKKHMQQGRINLENRKFRLCKSNFLTVMTLLSSNPNDPSYIDAKKFFDICDLAKEGT